MTDTQKPSIDWLVIKTDYANSYLTFADLAKKYNVKDVTLRSRSSREDWQRLRNTIQEVATKQANDATISAKVDRLIELNEIDLSAAQALRQKASELMRVVTTANELKAIAGTYDIAQKISRLALGAATENTNVSTRTLEPLKDTDFLG
jgi:uncharacterized protein YjcR